jgi:hypothetical protein
MGGEGRGAVVPLQTGSFLALSSLGPLRPRRRPLRGQEDVATTTSIRDDATTSVRTDPTLRTPPILRPRAAAAAVAASTAVRVDPTLPMLAACCPTSC